MGQEIEIFYTSSSRLDSLLKDDLVQVFDIFENLQEEFDKMLDPRKGSHAPTNNWVYYSWSKQLLNICDEKTLWLLRTNRNMHLVNPVELDTLKNTGILIAGLSVGSSMAIGMAYSGIKGPFYLADFDEISASNLNRLRAPLSQLGLNKAVAAKRAILELDPFTNVKAIEKAITKEDVQYILQDKAVKVVFDEVDDFKLKIDLRHEAKAHNIPLVMLTALGDTVLIDVERYDIDPDTKPFNGLVSEEDLAVAYDEPTPENIKKLSISIVGQDNVPQRAVESLMEMGKTLSGRPQLYGTIAMEGGVASFVVREIVLGRLIKSGRYKIDLSMIVNPRLNNE